MAYTTAVAGSTRTAATESETAIGTNTLGTDAFLNLLVTQIRYQDPLSGKQDTGEMIMQLSLFTVLEQVIKLQAEAEKQYAVMQNTQAFNLLNKEVVVETEQGYFNGIVTGVNLLGDQPVIILDGVAEFPLSSVVMVSGEQPAEETPDEDEEEQQTTAEEPPPVEASPPPAEEPPAEEPPTEATGASAAGGE